MIRRASLAGVALVLLVLPGVRAAATPRPPTAFSYLRKIAGLSPAPEYRRFGSAGAARVADYAAGQLGADGYTVRRIDVPHARYAPDYSRGHQPRLERLADAHSFKVESTFGLTKVTGPAGITCTARAAADVRPGDCGVVPFSAASPDFRNVTYGPGSVIDQIKSRGGIGAIVEGDTSRNAVLALRTPVAIPTIVAVATNSELIGQRFRLRVMGATEPAVLHNVIAVLPPKAGSRYVILTGHMDGWFQAAADNGSGIAAILRSAQLLSANRPDIGVVVALFDGEENGLLGSRAVAAQLARPDGVSFSRCVPPLHLADIVADINLDSSSARAKDVAGGQLPIFSWRAMVFSEEGAMASTSLSTFMAHGVAGLPINARAATVANGGMDRTDAHWFDAAGIPVAWPVAGYSEYHTDADTLSVIDPADLEALAHASADLVGRLASIPIGRPAGAPPLPPEAPFTPCSAPRPK